MSLPNIFSISRPNVFNTSPGLMSLTSLDSMNKVWYNESAVYTDIQEWDCCQEFDKEIHKNLFEQF